MIYQFASLEDFSQKIQLFERESQIYLVCAGFYGDIVGKWINAQNYSWISYLDNKESIYNKVLNGKKIDKINGLVFKNEYFIICSIYSYNDVAEQLLKNGVSNDHIIGFGNRGVFDAMLGEIENPTQYTKRIKELKGIAKDSERCFIIGNGPSLRIEDLERIGTECSFGTNHIFRCFSKTNWRPTGYFIQDPSWLQEDGENHWQQIIEECKYVFCSVKNQVFRDKKEEKIESLYFYYIKDSVYNNLPVFSENIEDTVGYASTTVYSMLQVAVYMGYKNIYLLGMDLGFGKETHLDGSVDIHEDRHVQAEFLNKEGDSPGIYEIDKILLGYQSAKNYAENHNIAIYNATRGGKLEIFPRVDIEKLF